MGQFLFIPFFPCQSLWLDYLLPGFELSEEMSSDYSGIWGIFFSFTIKT